VSFTTIERIETPRTVCARIRMSDVPELIVLLCDPRVAETLWPPGIGLPTERDVIDGTADNERHWERHGFGPWVQRDRETGELVGRGGLHWTHVADRDEVEVAWAVLPERWGQGLATELARASIDAAFGPLGLPEIVAFTRPHNAPSRRVMEKAGFAFDQEIVYAGLPHVLYRLRAPAG
jgi:[ribosomal protein S5]-alanine N-acetyltransferase